MRAALTFDAEHPDRSHRPGVDIELVSALAAAGVRATFFLEGRWTKAHPLVARRIVHDGHLVGSHSFAHARMSSLSPEGMRADVRAAEQTILDVAGVDPRPWFRCPYGAGWSDDAVQDVLAELGYRHVGWDVIADDWEPELGAATLARTVVDGVARCGGDAVVLLHLWPEQTLLALPDIVGGLRALGAELVGVDELARVPETVIF